MTTRKTHNDATLTIRLPDAVLKQYTTMCDGQYKTASEMTRNLILQYVNQHKDFLVAIDTMKQQNAQNPTRQTNYANPIPSPNIGNIEW